MPLRLPSVLHPKANRNPEANQDGTRCEGNLPLERAALVEFVYHLDHLVDRLCVWGGGGKMESGKLARGASIERAPAFFRIPPPRIHLFDLVVRHFQLLI